MNARIATAPQIGFDRFIQLDWVSAALKVRLGRMTLGELDQMFSAAGLGIEAKAKTRTKLNALALQPRANLADFINRGVELFADANTPTVVAPFAWGAALSVYPYFGRVAEFTGRLTSIQGDCSVAEIHRRMSELYGDREITKRATQAVLQSQANWGAIARVGGGSRLVRLRVQEQRHQQTAAWLIEAALRYQGKAIALATLPSMAVLYPFRFAIPISGILAKSGSLDVWLDGQNNQVVGLKAVI